MGCCWRFPGAAERPLKTRQLHHIVVLWNASKISKKTQYHRYLRLTLWLSSRASDVWPTPVPPHGAVAPAKFPLSVISGSEAANTPTGRVSVILTGQHGSSISLSPRAFYQRLLTLLEGDLSLETETFFQCPTSFLMLLSSPFLTFMSNMIKLLFGFPSWRDRFYFGQKHY